MGMLRWISDNTLKVRIKNDYQWGKLEVALLEDKIRHNSCTKETHRYNNKKN